jgi:membrane protease YdiL (CAAX protease family)
MASTRNAPSTDGATSVSDVERDERRFERGPSAASRRERQKDEFGGFSWLSTLAGWLSAAGLTAILTGILSAAGAALALNQVGSKVSGSEADTIGIAGGIALLVALAIAYLFGGYVAGRMARFDGARQGVGVWLWGILIALVVAALALIGGSKYNVLDALNLPRLPVDSGTLTTGGLVALAASLVVTLGAAILGGKTGERFHKKVDRLS